jgi:hypothetical protein
VTDGQTADRQKDIFAMAIDENVYEILVLNAALEPAFWSITTSFTLIAEEHFLVRVNY